MRVIIVGCGKIGTTILEDLVNEGHEVVALDSNPATLAEVTNIYDVIGVCGNGVDYEPLEEAGAGKAELLVAVTGSDEFNMLSCHIARQMGVKHTIARIRKPEYNDQSLGHLRQYLNLSMAINPELLTAQELFKILKLPSALTVETFSRRNFEMIEVVLRHDSALIGHPLIQLRKAYSAKFLVCVVQRGENVYVPDGNFVLQEGDRIGITATPNEIHKFLRQIGVIQKQAKSVMILGASRTAYYLAKMLLDNGTAVKVVDINRERCEEFAALLPQAVVIKGDGTQQELLLEEGMGSVDAFVSLTGMDELNILISFFANVQRVPKVIAKVNHHELACMAEKLGLECTISSKRIIADVLTRYARALKNSEGSNVETLYKLMDGKAEALEFRVGADFKGCDVPLKDLSLKPDILITGILRGRKTAILPSGDDVIRVGDKVVILAAGKRLDDLSDILL